MQNKWKCHTYQYIYVNFLNKWALKIYLWFCFRFFFCSFSMCQKVDTSIFFLKACCDCYSRHPSKNTLQICVEIRILIFLSDTWPVITLNNIMVEKELSEPLDHRPVICYLSTSDSQALSRFLRTNRRQFSFLNSMLKDNRSISSRNNNIIWRYMNCFHQSAKDFSICQDKRSI